MIKVHEFLYIRTKLQEFNRQLSFQNLEPIRIPELHH